MYYLHFHDLSSKFSLFDIQCYLLANSSLSNFIKIEAIISCRYFPWVTIQQQSVCLLLTYLPLQQRGREN